ncbi:SNF2 family N-terminal domain-containing protein [Umbelopsis sp. AD052]|nr:SNF2 family N-terminal domain-containing protein [Umbelopsis sp. AD052]
MADQADQQPSLPSEVTRSESNSPNTTSRRSSARSTGSLTRTRGASGTTAQALTSTSRPRSLFDSDGKVTSLNIINPNLSPAASTRRHNKTSDSSSSSKQSSPTSLRQPSRTRGDTPTRSPIVTSKQPTKKLDVAKSRTAPPEQSLQRKKRRKDEPAQSAEILVPALPSTWSKRRRTSPMEHKPAVKQASEPPVKAKATEKRQLNAKAVNSRKSVQKPLTPLEMKRQEVIAQREKELQSVVSHHDSTVREMFFLEVHQNMLDYDPAKWKLNREDRLMQYMQNFDLWSTVTEQLISKTTSASKGISTRRTLSQRRDSLLNMLQDSVGISAAQPGAKGILDPTRRITKFPGITAYRRPVREYPTLEEYLASFVSMEETEDITVEQANDIIVNEASLRDRIDNVKAQGGLNKSLQTALRRQVEPTRGESHHDMLMTQVVSTSKLFHNNSKYRKASAKKVAKAVERYWESLRTQDERLVKEEARRLQRLAKWTAQEVKKKWKVVERVCEARYKEMIQEEQAQRGKRHLDMILEHSEQMLGVRMGELASKHTAETPLGSDIDTPSSYVNGAGSKDLPTEEDDSDLEDPYTWQNGEDEADHFIDDQSSSDDEELGGLEADQDLPIEELLKKYNYPGQVVDDGSQDDDSQHGSNTDVDESIDTSVVQTIREDGTLDDEEDVQSASEQGSSSHVFTSTHTTTVATTEDHDAEFSALASDEDIVIEQDGDSEDDDVEINGLEDDANVPIEELLKRYGYGNHVSTDEDADDEEEDEVSEAEGSETGDAEVDAMEVSDKEITEQTYEQTADKSEIPIPFANPEELKLAAEVSKDQAPARRPHDADDDIDIIGVDEDIPGPDDDEAKDASKDIEMVDDSHPGDAGEEDSDGTETEMGDEVTEVSDDDDYQDVDKTMDGKEADPNSPPRSSPAPPTMDEKKSTEQSSQALVESNPSSTSVQPTGTTLSTTTVSTKVPFLLRGTLREYQHVGLDWMASLYANGLNGILADEMGLGKTIQTIALLAYLACEKGIWGPHLVVVPTSVMLNWEMEFKKWLPGFKILTYYGNPKERKEKRLGWSKENAFHVCITSYQLVCHDQTSFRRKAWQYLILDEAHHIKNFRSQRWQVLLNFNAERRLLLTGTPLQNNLMELWSLLYFLMPNGASQSMPMGFANQKEFQEWFSHPVDRMIENEQPQMDEASRAAIQKLHTVLRPYLLRRLKIDVEKQMPAKYEHVVYCRLSKRQRYLYDDFMGRGKTKETLASGNFLSIINCLMQLRKVCNHPDLFEVRPIVTSFAMSDSVQITGSITELLIRRHLISDVDMLRERFNLEFFNFDLTKNESCMSATAGQCMNDLRADPLFEARISHRRQQIATFEARHVNRRTYYDLKQHARAMRLQRAQDKVERLEQMYYINKWRCAHRPMFGTAFIDFCRTATSNSVDRVHETASPRLYLERPDAIESMVVPYDTRVTSGSDIWKRYAFVTPSVLVRDWKALVFDDLSLDVQESLHQLARYDMFHGLRTCLSIAFPDKRLLQYDCGKLQKLDTLLRDLKAGGHRALIFTQMTRVLDVLEIFLNIHGHRYLRLDGATKVEQRQILTERFNNDKRILAFILSTRSGGLGINLTGADTVIFYDSDWNPSMDKQCQDRTHRIGQTRDVHIYRFVTEFTIEENIFKKANQKRMLDNVIIQEGDFTTEYFEKMDWWKDLPEVAGSQQVGKNNLVTATSNVDIEQALLEAEDDETDAKAAIAARREMRMDEREFADTPTQDKVVGTTMSSRSATNSPGPREIGTTFPSEDHPMDTDAIDEEISEKEMQIEVGHVDQYMLRFWEREMFGQYLGFGGLAAPESVQS